MIPFNESVRSWHEGVWQEDLQQESGMKKQTCKKFEAAFRLSLHHENKKRCLGIRMW